MDGEPAPAPAVETDPPRRKRCIRVSHNSVPVNGFPVACRVDPGRVLPAWRPGEIPGPGHAECHRRSLMSQLWDLKSLAFRRPLSVR